MKMRSHEQVKESILLGLTYLIKTLRWNKKAKAKAQRRIDNIDFVVDFAMQKQRAPTDYEIDEHLASLEEK